MRRETEGDGAASAIDAETKASEGPSDHKVELRLWLRLLTCTTLVEGGIRRRLRSRFDTTLPRFDLMAQLEKAPDGLTLGEISRRMMVSNGNVTGLVERLASEGLVERRASPSDRRAANVRLTSGGRAIFAEMARAHAEWLADMFGGLTNDDIDGLMALLARTKRSTHRAITGTETK